MERRQKSSHLMAHSPTHCTNIPLVIFHVSKEMSESIGRNDTDPRNKNEPEIEQIFNVIQCGNDATDMAQWWPAADHYMNACESLLLLLSSKSTITTKPRQNDDDQEKLQLLYQEQINFYYQKTRSCIIQGLQQQQHEEQDESEQTPNDTTTQNGNQSDHQYQFNIIYRFYNFHYPVTIPPPTTTQCKSATTTASQNPGNVLDTTIPPVPHQNNDDDDDTTTCQLEERLRQLNATLPSHLKSAEEIHRQRQEQLRRIGVPEVPGPMSLLLPDDTTTINDPVAAIIAQVTEQVRLCTPTNDAEEEEEEEETIQDDTRDFMEQILRDTTTSEDDPDDDDDDEDENFDDNDDDDDTTPVAG